jgi:hypothetical protein
VLENKVVRKIYGLRKTKSEFIILHNEELCDLYRMGM